jgi:hypothetical protein
MACSCSRTEASCVLSISKRTKLLLSDDNYATQRNATQRNATQHNTTQCIDYQSLLQQTATPQSWQDSARNMHTMPHQSSANQSTHLRTLFANSKFNNRCWFRSRKIDLCVALCYCLEINAPRKVQQVVVPVGFLA